MGPSNVRRPATLPLNRLNSKSRQFAGQIFPTITTASGRISSDNTLHPTEHRVLSPLECQHLQTFKPTFNWGDALEDHGVMNLRAMIGEAVPPLFTEMHGRVLVRVLEGTVARAMRATDPRVVSARRSLGLD